MCLSYVERTSGLSFVAIIKEFSQSLVMKTIIRMKMKPCTNVKVPPISWVTLTRDLYLTSVIFTRLGLNILNLKMVSSRFLSDRKMVSILKNLKYLGLCQPT